MSAARKNTGEQEALPGVVRMDGSVPADQWCTMAQVTPRKLTWLWPGRIPAGMITILEGRKSTGKSTLLAAIAGAVTGVSALPGMKKSRKRAAVVWLSAEEDASLIVWHRLQSARIPPDLVHTLKADPATGMVQRIILPGDLGRLDDKVQATGAKLVVADPWGSFVSGMIDLHQEAQVRSVLEPLAGWAAHRGVTVVLTRHVRKNRSGPALDQGLGGVGVGNVARMILRCDPHPVEDDVFTLSKVAGNLCAPQPTLTYRCAVKGESVAVEWIGETDLDADTLAEAAGDTGERDERNDAILLLQYLIGDSFRPYREIVSEAREGGISERTLRKAKKELSVRSKRIVHGNSAHWEWGPPLAGWKRT